MTLYCGIDLHSNNNVVAVLDENDRAIYERRLPNDPGLVIGVLDDYRTELAACVMESTYKWHWLVDGRWIPGAVGTYRCAAYQLIRSLLTLRNPIYAQIA